MAECKTEPIYVQVKFQRIQTYLFAIPRLRAMLGANALLGETIRKNLPEVCQDLTCPLDFQFQLDSPCDDPLDQVDCNEDLKDNPKLLYKKGILSRDGGYFIVVLKSPGDLQIFISRVQEVLTECPGLRYTINYKPFNSSNEDWNSWQAEPIILDPHLPFYEICRETGLDWASHKQFDERQKRPSAQEDQKTPEIPVSARAAQLRDEGANFYKKKSKDLISLLSSQFPGSGSNKKFLFPIDLEDFSKRSGGYLALIQIDGNQIGLRSKMRMEEFKEQSSSRKEAANEVFYHALRVAMRRGLCSALHSTFGRFVERVKNPGSEVLPYQVLMLGGDDMMLLTRPEFALRFVHHLACSLRDKRISFLPGQPRPVSFAASVVIAKHNLPIYRLAEISDMLLSGAKRLYRSQTLLDGDCLPPERSTVDWTVATSSWLTELDAHRRSQEYVEIDVGGVTEQLALTGKPYFILPGPVGCDPIDSLSGLLDAADGLRSSLKRDSVTREAPKLPDLNCVSWSTFLAREGDSANGNF